MFHTKINETGYAAITDNFAIKDEITTAGTRALENYKPFYNSTLISKLGNDSIKYITKINEYNFPDKMENGSAIAVSEDKVKIGITSDNGISTAYFAKKESIIGFSGTYGSISRFGLYSAFPSFERVSIFSKDINEIKNTFNLIKGVCSKDMTTITTEDIQIQENEFKIYKEELLKNELLELMMPVYKTIISAEATSSLSNLNGISAGKRESNDNIEDLIKDFRTANLTQITKTHLIIGAHALSSDNREDYYIKSTKFRSLIQKEINKIFDNYDLIETDNNNESSLIAAFLGLPILSFKNTSIIGNLKADAKVISYYNQIKEDL